MSRIHAGIMTFHWAANYGAVLQAWALQEYLLHIGIDAEFIDYVPSGYEPTLKRCLRAKRPKHIISYYQEYRKEKYLEMFRQKYLNRSNLRFTHKDQLNANPPRYDVYISGSDQIWNPYFTMNGQRGVSLPYYLDFAPNNATRIAFSSSFGLSDIPAEMKNVILPELLKYKSISSREKAGVDILKSMGIHGALTADPTLLLEAASYRALISQRARKGQLYFYCLHGHRSAVIDVARKYAKSVQLCLAEDECKSIEEWLSNIANADFVITNSFHGTVFCILFHIPFVTFEKKTSSNGMGSRLVTLLDAVGMNERFCLSDELSERLEKLKDVCIDWETVDSKVAELRREARNYLRNALDISEDLSVHSIDLRKCMGCGLCKTVCPVDCISMEENELGFWYPKVNPERCIQCGLCSRSCIIENKPTALKSEAAAYACYHKDEAIRQKSSSGGAFTAMAQSFLAQGGVVVGAAFTKPMEVEHICVDDAQGLDKLRGSKYMASSCWNAFPAIKRALTEGKKVLFSGTPCQVAAIKIYTNYHSDLFCIDVACHGVPSGSALKAHCSEIEKRTGCPVSSINFRDKITGWRSYSYSYMDENGHVIKRERIDESTIGRAYVENLILRSSCMECSFACKQRQGDLTLCDHWRIVHLGLDKEDKGITAVLVNSEKGSHVMEAAAEQMNVVQIKPEEVYAGNPVLCHPAGKNPSRNGFFATMQQHGYKHSIEKYCATPSLMKKVVRKIKHLLK